MIFLFATGFLGALAGLVVGLVTGDLSLGILISLSGIAAILFSLPFLVLPLPVQLLGPIDLRQGLTVNYDCKSCGKKIGERPPEDDLEIDPDDDPDDDDDPSNPDWGDVPGKPFEGR